MRVKFFMDNGLVVDLDNIDTEGKNFREWANWVNYLPSDYLVCDDTSIKLSKVSHFMEIKGA